ncbi:MAG: hypothetical protein QOF02_4042 [Blastocatellia bacterium]|jgi:hypothetical protein|nr:hypothetical protein [Blastocatellia bacterium]
MADEHIATYLNDHLAGSVVALELLEHLEAAHKGSPLESFVAELRADIEADRKELESLMSALNISESRTRKASAWLTEKVTELKLRLDDPAADGDLRLLESIEAVALGIDGKRALWRALATAAEDEPKLRALDYERLERRAEEQRSRVETARLDAAKKALVPVS